MGSARLEKREPLATYAKKLGSSAWGAVAYGKNDPKRRPIATGSGKTSAAARKEAKTEAKQHPRPKTVRRRK